MVTGVETAGLVLGSIPLILAGLEFYAKGIAVTKRYWKYKAEFKSLVNDLRTEHALSTNSIEMLLTGVVRPKDMAEFLANPCSERWKEDVFERKLKDRLGPTYEPYIGTINQMSDATGEFKARLKLDPTGKPQFNQEKAFKEHFKRLKFSLQKSDYADLMSKLRQANVSLYRMTNQALSLENLRNPRKTKSHPIPKFNIIHDRVKGLYFALYSGWKCSCHADHSVSLRLESRIGDVSSDEDETEDEDDSPSPRDPFRVFFRYDHHHSVDVGNLTAPWTWEEADVRITCESSLQGSQKPLVKGSTKGVRFASQTKKVIKVTVDPKPNLQPMQDLCTAIRMLRTPQLDVCLSLLATEHAEQKYGIVLYPLKQPRIGSDMWRISTLRNVLTDSKFASRDRLRLAVTLASSVLQLHETPWLQDNLGKDNIFFVSRADKTMYEHPFISRYFSRVEENPGSSGVASASAMSRIIRNQTLYALGISLIELWYKKPLQELHKPEDGPPSSDDPLTSSMTEWNTANRLVEELYDDAGEKYSNAVRRCIRCDFDHRGSSLEDLEFQKAVYRGVVAQLQENFEFLFDRSYLQN